MSGGGRSSRFAELVIVRLHACSFVTSAIEFHTAQIWARSKISCGNAQRDRMAFAARFETLVGRHGSGVATRGSRGAVRQVVDAMRRSGMELEEWIIPINLDESMEVAKKKPLTS